jgi:hypothetical protein
MARSFAGDGIFGHAKCLSRQVTESVSHWPYLPTLIRIAGLAVGKEGRAVARQTIRYRYWLPAPQRRWGLFEAFTWPLDISLADFGASTIHLPDWILPFACREVI